MCHMRQQNGQFCHFQTFNGRNDESINNDCHLQLMWRYSFLLAACMLMWMWYSQCTDRVVWYDAMVESGLSLCVCVCAREYKGGSPVPQVSPIVFVIYTPSLLHIQCYYCIDDKQACGFIPTGATCHCVARIFAERASLIADTYQMLGNIVCSLQHSGHHTRLQKPVHE